MTSSDAVDLLTMHQRVQADGNVTKANPTICGSFLPGAATIADAPLGARYRLDCIASAALHNAMERGCDRGYETQDWITAEAQVLAEMYGLTGFSS